MTLTRMGLCLGVLLQAVQVQALMLGGTNVPKEKMVVYLLIGHSNMAGVDGAKSDGVTNPRAWHYPINTKQWVLAKEPPVRGNTVGLSLHGAGGPGMPFLKGMAAAYPDYYFGVVNNASPSSTCRGENTGSNGSDLDASDNRFWKGTYLYAEILTAAKAIQPDVTLGGILCMLGAVEATRTSVEVCNAFSDDLAQLAKDLRTDLGMPNLPFIMGEYETGAKDEFAITLPMPSIILAQSKLLPSKLAFSASVDTKDIHMLDNHHFSADKGHPEWAKRAIAQIQAKSLFPGATAISIQVPDGRGKAAAGAAGPRLILEAGGRAVLKDEGIYRINGASWTPATLKE